MVTEHEKQLLKKLTAVVKSFYPDSYFSTTGYKEEAVCLERVGNKWDVYNAERGNRFEEKEYDVLLEACVNFFKLLTNDKEKIDKMCDQLLSNMPEVA